MKLLAHLSYLLRYWKRNQFVFGRYASLRKIVNFMRAEWDSKHKNVVVHSRPWEVFIDPVNICPLQCPLCATGMRLHGRGQTLLPFITYQRYLDQMAPWLYRVKLFNYGEPFLNPALFDMIDYTHRAGIAVQVNSNLNVWKDDFAERCVKSGLDTLTVSFDGVSQEAYGSYRIGGDVAKVKKAVIALAAAKKRLGAKHPEIILQFLMQKHNVHEYQTAADFANEYGCIFFPQPLTFDITDSTQRTAWLPGNEKQTHYDRINLCKKKRHPEKGCGFLWNNCVINTDGGISPCCHLFYKSTDFGSLATDSFATIWNNEAFRTARTLQKNKTAAGTAVVCSRCLNEKAFTDARFDLVNEYRSNLLK